MAEEFRKWSSTARSLMLGVSSSTAGTSTFSYLGEKRYELRQKASRLEQFPFECLSTRGGRLWEASMRVLIAEDNALVALMIEVVLGDEGHEVVGTATTAKAALSLIEQARPDLLIADIHLDDGESGCDLVVEAHKRWGTPALFVSGWPDKVQSCDTAIGVLSKPFFPEAVHAAIKVAAEILEGRPPGPVPRELRLFPEFRVPDRDQETPRPLGGIG